MSNVKVGPDCLICWQVKNAAVDPRSAELVSRAHLASGGPARTKLNYFNVFDPEILGQNLALTVL